MNTSEYQLLKIEYSDEDKANIKKYNSSHVEKALSLLKYNRDKLLDDKDYEKLELGDRIKYIQIMMIIMSFAKPIPLLVST